MSLVEIGFLNAFQLREYNIFYMKKHAVFTDKQLNIVGMAPLQFELKEKKSLSIKSCAPHFS